MKPRIIVALSTLALIALTACGGTNTPEPTSWLQLVNDNWFFIFLLIAMIIPAGGWGFGRGKCRCERKDDE